MNPMKIKTILFSFGLILFTQALTWPFSYENILGETTYSLIPITIGLLLMLPIIIDFINNLYQLVVKK